MPYRDLDRFRRYQRTWARERRSRLRRAGCCTDCGGDRDSRWLRCASCRAQVLTRIAARQALRRRLGLCVDCGHARDSDAQRCLYCRLGLLMRVERAQFKRRMQR